jgi:hypothetical protein
MFHLSGMIGLAQETKPGAPGASPGSAPALSAKPAAEVTGFQALSERLDKAIHQAKQPASWWKMGGEIRLREEYFNNGVTLNQDAPRHEQHFVRFRFRWWNTITPVTNLDLNVRITAEPRQYLKPSTHQTPITGWDWTEGIIDNLNFKWNNALDLPATLTVGRQEIMIGEPMNWWLVFDGTPRDGSRTFYYDAARLTYQIKECKTTADAIYIDQGARNDRWVPPINRIEKYQIDQNERGAILQLANKSFAAANMDGFFIYKHDDKVLASGDNADLYTIGSRLAGDVAKHWRYYAEGAYQWGRKDNARMDAFGVNSRLTFFCRDHLNNQARMSYEFLSGDDPRTARMEQFDVLWGRWPHWSELYNIQSYTLETRVGQTANLHRIGPGWSITPLKNMNFTADYYLLLADQNRNPTLANAALFGSGIFRGHYLQAILKHKLSDHLSGHLWGEFVWPGDYYTHRDLLSWFRAEIMITF